MSVCYRSRFLQALTCNILHEKELTFYEVCGGAFRRKVIRKDLIFFDKACGVLVPL